MEKKNGSEILLTTCSASKPEEKLLFVTDSSSYPVARMMWDAAAAFPNKSLVMMEDRNMHGEEPTDCIASAMAEADVIFGCTKFSLFHSSARKNAVKNGARFVNMVDYNPRMLENGGLFCDFDAVGDVCTAVAKKIEGKSVCRITTSKGTDFTCSIEGRSSYPQYGRSLSPGISSSPPNIECATCAVEGTANGVVIIDGSIPHPQLGLINEDIYLEIKDGKIVGITGGEQAKILETVLATFENSDVYHIGEIGLGLNPMCVLNGSMLEDEGCGGTVHLACGDNVSFGGTISCPCHLDMIFRNPTVYVDETAILVDGIVVT